MAEEEEVAMEVEAVQAVYGEDCIVLNSYPPHLQLHIKPRTADISSQQFVEAIMGIQADLKYPEDPPLISLLDSKGLDDRRQKHLMSTVREKAHEFSSSLMLVALCEEAVERLTVMNHPDGDCPLCLYPLVPEDGQSTHLPFMKLMSCFHCFHCECIIRWWNWLLTQKEADSNDSSSDALHPPREMHDQHGNPGLPDKNLGNCPVCRKVFDASDLEHVLGLISAKSSQQGSDATVGEENSLLLQSDSENIRRERFEAILKLQEERGGLVQTKKSISVVPGMYLPPTTSPKSSTREASENEETETKAAVGTDSSSCSNRTGSSRNRNFNRKKQSAQKPVRSTRQWVQKR
ncbi:PREDICTED: E3 ubiquitin-protein ligase RNF25 [Tarenaya hassleriana]|uniref:E3 ubiquitin-protein ligase RNF25 n=1 Tax=Tarenaya hassleriana TaxID=28532 RepID=UPI00053C2D6A|nr:PREDICTED: E3 ubiquitin-protein ligase RNF25 [Tarenaya hassleriana]